MVDLTFNPGSATDGYVKLFSIDESNEIWKVAALGVWIPIRRRAELQRLPRQEIPAREESLTPPALSGPNGRRRTPWKLAQRQARPRECDGHP